MCTSILRYACPIDWEFPDKGALDLMPAGRQDAAYPHRVTSFNWQEFYDVLGGGVFLEALKRHLREDYDYVLIDSRTGISDTAGICTVQMPDSIVVCFTLNRQSILGAAAVAQSIESQRLKPNGEPGIHIWPVPTRIELAEKERLESARDLAHVTFQRHLGRMKRDERPAYWGGVEVLYQPFFAYEEVLAVFAERHGRSSSMLTSMETLAGHISGEAVSHFRPMSEDQRRRGLALFTTRMRNSPGDSSPAEVYLSYPRSHAELAARIISSLQSSTVRVWSDRVLLPGDDWRASSDAALASSRMLVVLIAGGLGPYQRVEVERALDRGIRVIPVLAPELSFKDLPDVLSHVTAIRIEADRPHEALEDLKNAVERTLARRSDANVSPVSADDPQKGRWGGLAEHNGRRLSATVEPVTDDWFSVTLLVESASGQPIDDTVTFHLHPTFPREVVPVQPHDGHAELKLAVWGAFTVGVVADGGRTRLELDLSENPRFPETFRSR